MRVVIADDHSVVRVGLRILINASRRCVIVGEADSADSLMNLLSSTPCDLLITDFSMPGGQQADGLKMLSTIQRHYPALPIILVTMFTSVATARAALAQGAMAVVAKTASAKELPLAINAVLEGRTILSLQPGHGPGLHRTLSRQKRCVASGAADQETQEERQGMPGGERRERRPWLITLTDRFPSGRSVGCQVIAR